jgi:hypothetical protein
LIGNSVDLIITEEGTQRADKDVIEIAWNFAEKNNGNQGIKSTVNDIWKMAELSQRYCYKQQRHGP